jgi:hypothetical protein
MKNLKIALAALSLVGLTTACHMNSRHVIIADGDNSSNTRIEYWGRAFFNEDGTAISHISSKGSVIYKRDGRELIAESNNQGEVVYSVNGGEKRTNLNGSDKVFLAQAVKDMIKHGHYSD